MSELSQLSPSTRSLGPYKLSRLTLSAIGEIETTLQEFAFARAVRFSIPMEDGIRKEFLASRISDIEYYYAYGMASFNNAAKKSVEGRLLSLLVSVGMSDKKTAPKEIAAKIEELDDSELDSLVAWVWGDDPGGSRVVKKKQSDSPSGPTGVTEEKGESTGETSTAVS